MDASKERQNATRSYRDGMEWFMFTLCIVVSSAVVALVLMQPPASAQEGESTSLNLSRKERRLCFLTVAVASVFAVCAMVM